MQEHVAYGGMLTHPLTGSLPWTFSWYPCRLLAVGGVALCGALLSIYFKIIYQHLLCARYCLGDGHVVVSKVNEGQSNIT